MPRHDPIDDKLDQIRKSLERAVADLKMARAGDRSYGRITLISDTLHEAYMALHHMKDELDIYGTRARAKAERAARMRLPAPDFVGPPHVTPIAKRRALPAPGESIFG